MSEASHSGFDGEREFCEERLFDHADELGDAGCCGRPFDESGGRGGFEGGAVARTLDQPDRQIGIPAHLPGFTERAGGASTLHGDTPADAERDEAVQEVRLASSGRGAQVDLDGSGFGTHGEPGRLRQLGDVAGEWHLRRRVGDLTDRVADDQLTAYEVEPTRHGVGGVEHFGEADARPPAHRRERGGQTGAGDQVVGRCSAAAVTHESGGVDEEPNHPVLAGMLEHVAVPARAVDAGAVPRVGGEAAVGPRHPGDADLRLGRGRAVWPHRLTRSARSMR